MKVNISDLNDIFSKAFDEPTNITIDTVRDDIGAWHSINHLNLIVELEDFYKVQFTMDEVKEMFSVKEIIAIIERK